MSKLPLFLLALTALGSFAIAAEPASGSKGGAVTDPKDALAGIPREVMQGLRYGSRDGDSAAAKATAQTRKNLEGKEGSFKMTVQAVEQFQRKDSPDVTRTRLRQSNESVREGGVTFDVYLVAIVDESEKAKLAKIQRGSRITVTGKISNAEIMVKKNTELHIDVMDAKIE